MGPRGPVRAEGGVGLGRGWVCIGFQLITLRVGLSGVGEGRVGPVRAKWGWGVHWELNK